MSKKLIFCITVLLFSVLVYAKGAFVEVGDPSFFPDDFTDLVSVKIDNDGNIYAAYIQNDRYFSVAKFDGESWSDVGERNFSGEMGNVYGTPEAFPYVSFTLSNDGVPFVSFPEAQNYSLNIMKFNSGSGKWEYVGKSNITDYKVFYTSVAVDPEGAPYAIFSGCNFEGCEGINEDTLQEYSIGKVSVIKFNGTEWGYVDVPVFFDRSQSENNKILFDSKGVPYIAFSHGTSDVFVMKFNGTEWEMVGDTDVMDIKYFGYFLIDDSDSLYLTFYSNDQERILTKFDKTEWNNLADLEKGRNNFTVDRENKIIQTTDLESTGLSVKKLNDEGFWEIIGDEEYIRESVYSALVETDQNNIPYVAFAEKKGVVLMKYDPEAVENPDDPDDETVSDEDTTVDENEAADEGTDDDNDTVADENSTADDETVSDEDSAPVNDKDSGSSGCTMVVF